MWAGKRTALEILRYKDRPLPPDEPGLAIYLPMNEVAGNAVLNAYAGAPGLFVNENNSWTTTGVPFNPGNALSLDGVDDWVFVNGITKHAPFEFSAEAWIKFNPTTTQDAYTIISKGDANTGTIFSVWADDKLAFYPGGAGVNWVFSDTTVPRNKWVHVAVAHGGTDVKFYLDGKLAGQPSVSANRVINQGPSLGIGNQSGAGNGLVNMFSGEIDNVRIWNDVRTSTEIASNMLSVISRNEQGLVARYQMDVKTSPTAFDESVNKFHGQILNGLTRVPSSIINVSNTPDPITGKVSNGIVSIGDLLSSTVKTTYDNLIITKVPDLGSIFLPGEVVVDIPNGTISGTPSSIKVFGITFDTFGLTLRNGKLGLDVEIKPPNEFFKWDSADRVFLLIDSNAIEIDGGKIGVNNANMIKMTVEEAFVDLRASTKEFGGGASFRIPGAGIKGKLLSPKVVGGEFKMKNGIPTFVRLSGENLGIPLGHEQIKLHTVIVEGENLQDLYNMKLKGRLKITGGPSIPLPNGTTFPISLDAHGEITPSNGNIDITSGVSVFSYQVASANIKFRPSEGTLSVNNAFIDMILYRPTVNMAVRVNNGEVKFTGNLKGDLIIPKSVFWFLTEDYRIASTNAAIHGPDHFSGSVAVNIFNLHDVTVGFGFSGSSGVSVFDSKVQYPGLAWETPFVKTHDLEHGTMSFMTNWTREDKTTSSGLIRPFQVNPAGDPITTFTIPEGTADVIFRITYENPNVTDIQATLTRADQSVIDIHEEIFDDESGFSGVDTETREAGFFLVDPEAGDYTITILNPENLGEYSVEMLVEDEEPFMDLVAVFPIEEESNEFDILWFGTDEDDLEVRLFLDRNREGLDGIEITDVEHFVEDDETMIAASVDGIAPGWYFPYLTIFDGKSGIAHDYANAPILITNDEHPESIKDFSVTPISNGFTVNWTPNGDETVTHHTIMYTTKRVPGDFDLSKITGPNASSFTVNGLENGVPVLVTVVAGREDGLQSAAEVVARVVPTQGAGATPAVIYSEPVTEAIAGQDYLYSAYHYDGDFAHFILPGSTPETLQEKLNQFGSTYKWELRQGPEGMVVDEQSGELIWTPTENQVGEHHVTLVLIDQRINSSYQTIHVQEYPVTVFSSNVQFPDASDNAFRFVTNPTITAFRGTRYSYAGTAAFPDSFTIRWDLVHAPDGMDVTDNGELYWEVPEDAVSTYVSLEAVIDDGITEVIVPQTFFLDVKDLPDDVDPPTTHINDWSAIE